MTDPDFEAIKREYDRDGFVVLCNYLDEGKLATLREHAIPLATRLMANQPNEGKYRNLLKSLHRHDNWFDGQLKSGSHVPLLRHLLADDVYGASAAWFDRPEGDAGGIEPHVDAIGRDQNCDAGVTIWFALDPVDETNGCLYYLRGSHRQRHPNTMPIPHIDTQCEDAVPAALNPGDVVIHSARTVHWSSGNASDRPRRAVSYFYFSASAYQVMLEAQGYAG